MTTQRALMLLAIMIELIAIAIVGYILYTQLVLYIDLSNCANNALCVISRNVQTVIESIGR